MKKLLAILLALAVIGGAAFAQVTFNGYNRTTFQATEGALAMANRVRLNMSFTDKDGNFGFWGRLQNADSAAPTMSYAYGWLNLADKKVKITAGKLGNYDYDLSSGVSEYQLGNVSNDMVGLDATMGMLVQFLPVEGLNIGLTVEPSAAKIGLDNFGLNAKYDIKDVGAVVVTSMFAEKLADSAASVSFNFTAVKDLSIAAGFKYGESIGYKAAAAKNKDVYTIIDYAMDALSLQVAAEYDITASLAYVEGCVGYTMGAFTFQAIGAYDQGGAILGTDATKISYALNPKTGTIDATAAKAAVPSTYLAGLEVLYKAGKATITTGIWLDDAASWTVPFAVKVAF